ncbi:smr (Small MutS Related) domain-containing protein [Euphorbia peplus]|nr:smr (Small MutS Related) domain-containing protein [Euphorbia peplus]
MKKKRHRPSRASAPRDGDQQKVSPLLEAFDSISFRDDSGEDQSSDPLSSSDLASGSSTTGSYSGSSEGFMEGNIVNRKGFRGSNKDKRVLAITGTVSTVIGKEYVNASPRRDYGKARDFGNGGVGKEDAEQFLCSMLGEDCDLSMAVVRDVLCQCGYNVDKALDALLDLSASATELSRNGRYINDIENYNKDSSYSVEHNVNTAARDSDCTSNLNEGEVYEGIWGDDCRNYFQALTSSEVPSTSPSNDVSDLPHKVLESLFKMPRSSEHEPGTMNWRNVAKKMQLLGPGIDVCLSSDAVPQQENYAKGAEYHVYREPANQHWDSTRSYYQRAAMAYSNGDRRYASYLSDQGQVHTQMARKADEKASRNIFKARNKDIENVITIDLHGQHVKQALRLLKLHLLFGTYVRSVQTLRIITGCGSHGVGKSKLKQSIIELMEKEGIRWSEENRGTVLIKLDGFKEFSFLDSDSDTE